MDKGGNTPLRVIVIAGFSLSCFGLVLFLWLSFGGPIPLKPKQYIFQVAFPDATALVDEADVRTAGVSIGKVSSKKLAPDGNLTLATVRLKPKFAPVRSDARAILRQKTLLGETYVELTTGTKQAPILPDGAKLAQGQVQQSVSFDQFLRTLDKPTQEAFRFWQKSTAKAFGGRGRDINDAFGSLPGFLENADDILDVLNRRRATVRQLVNQTGGTFQALNSNEASLQRFITRTRDTFDITARRNDDIAATFQILPTFQRETRRTLRVMERFAKNTNPLVTDLKPVLRDLQPTLVDLRELSPDLKQLFRDIDPLITAAERGTPALTNVLQGLRPVLSAVPPFLQELNPLLQFLAYNQPQVSDFISNGAAALGIKVATTPGDNASNGHALPQVIMLGSQTLPATKRTPDNRGNTYLPPGALQLPNVRKPNARFIFPSFDCGNAGGPGGKDATSTPACVVADSVPFQGMTQRFPNVNRAGPGGVAKPLPVRKPDGTYAASPTK